MKKHYKASLFSLLLTLLALADIAQAHYSPELGRFLSRDPIEERGGINVHAFVKNNPVEEFDKLGLAIASEYIDYVPDKCTIEVILGHGALSGENGQRRHDWRDIYVNPPADTIHWDFVFNPNLGGLGGYCFLGCNANDLNDLIPQDQQIIPPRLPFEPGGQGIWSAGVVEMYEAVMNSVSAALNNGSRLCDKPTCCKEWQIRIRILPDVLRIANFAELNGPVLPGWEAVRESNLLLLEKLRNLNGATQVQFCPNN